MAILDRFRKKRAEPAEEEPARPEPLKAKPARYQCSVCGEIYDPAKGDPEAGIAPGTPFEDLPDDWRCPRCGVNKKMFTKMAG